MQNNPRHPLESRKSQNINYKYSSFLNKIYGEGNIEYNDYNIIDLAFMVDKIVDKYYEPLETKFNKMVNELKKYNINVYNIDVGKSNKLAKIFDNLKLNKIKDKIGRRISKIHRIIEFSDTIRNISFDMYDSSMYYVLFEFIIRWIQTAKYKISRVPFLFMFENEDSLVSLIELLIKIYPDLTLYEYVLSIPYILYENNRIRSGIVYKNASVYFRDDLFFDNISDKDLEGLPDYLEHTKSIIEPIS